MTALWRYVCVAALVQLAVACSGEETSSSVENWIVAANEIATQAPAADAKLVLAFGDSLYAGYQLEPNQSFPAVLERTLAAQGVAARVMNAGVSGDTSAAAQQRLAFTLDGLERKPDLAIVGLGGNDALRGLSPEETRRNMDAILGELRRREIPVLLTGMMAPRNMGPDYAAAFDPIFPALAQEYGAELYPFFLDGVITQPELLLADGMHPNAQGIEAIVGRVAPRVSARLEADAAR